jgi:hypothetical protein
MRVLPLSEKRDGSAWYLTLHEGVLGLHDEMNEVAVKLPITNDQMLSLAVMLILEAARQ